MSDGHTEHATKTDITRRAALVGLGVAAAGYVAFGPTPRDKVPSGRIVLDYWEKWTGSEGLAMRRLVDRFNQSQTDIFVRYLTIGSIDQKAMIAIAGGSPPDIVGLWSFNIPAFAEAGALLPLDELARSKGLSPERYARAVWPMMTHRDRLWSMVSTCGTVALYINDDKLSEAGITDSPAPTTIEELDELSEALTVRRSSGDIESVGFIHTDPGWWSWLWGYHFGGNLLDIDTNSATANSEANVRAYEWVQSYPSRMGSRDLLKLQSGLGYYGTAQAPFLTGKVAMQIQGPWMANLIEAFDPDLNYRAIPMPTTRAQLNQESPVGLIDGDLMVIPSGAKNPEASFEFIAWMQQRTQIEELAQAHGKISPLRDTTAEFLATHPNRSISTHAAIADSPRAFGFPKTRVWPRYVSEFDAAFQRIWLQETDPASALALVNERAQFALDEAADRRQRRGR